MAELHCEACADIRRDYPEFVVNGLTNEMCTSLSNNTGLKPSSGNDDCEDLHNLNNCLVGNMAAEIEKYDVCDWKEFMRKYIPNDHTLLKALICSECGQWEQIEAILSQSHDDCELIESLLNPPVKKYGSLPSATQPTTVARRCGTIPNKNGRPIMLPVPNEFTPGTEQYDNFNNWQNAGIQYAKKNMTSCSTGVCTNYEWVFADIHNYRISKDVEFGDVLWYCDKATAQSVIGLTDYFWHTFDVSSWTWTDLTIEDGSDRGKNVWIRLNVNPGGMGSDYIGLEYRGTSYPNMPPDYDAIVSVGSNPSRLYRSRCDWTP